VRPDPSKAGLGWGLLGGLQEHLARDRVTFPAYVLVFSKDECKGGTADGHLAVEAEGVAALIRRVGVWVHGHERGVTRLHRRFELARRPDVPDAAAHVERIDRAGSHHGLERLIGRKSYERVETSEVVFQGPRRAAGREEHRDQAKNKEEPNFRGITLKVFHDSLLLTGC